MLASLLWFFTIALKLSMAMTLQEQGDAATVQSLREKQWLKLLSDVQQANSTSSDRVQLVLQLLEMMYDSGTKVNAMHISGAVTVSFFLCP